MIVVDMNNTIPRHGDQATAKRMNSETIDTVFERLLRRQFPCSIVAQSGCIELAKSVSFTKIIDHY